MEGFEAELGMHMSESDSGPEPEHIDDAYFGQILLASDDDDPLPLQKRTRTEQAAVATSARVKKAAAKREAKLQAKLEQANDKLSVVSCDFE